MTQTKKNIFELQITNNSATFSEISLSNRLLSTRVRKYPIDLSLRSIIILQANTLGIIYDVNYWNINTLIYMAES